MYILFNINCRKRRDEKGIGKYRLYFTLKTFHDITNFKVYKVLKDLRTSMELIFAVPL